MSMLRANTSTIVRSLAIASAIGWLAASSAQAQYPFGGGAAYPGYGYGTGGYVPGFGGYGPGFGSFGPGFIGGSGFGPSVYSNMGVGVGTVASGYGSVVAGYGSPMPFGGIGYGYGAPGYGPSGVGYANPLFSMGLSPLAVQNAIAERNLLGRPATIVRRVPQAIVPPPTAPATGSVKNRTTPPPR